MNRMMNRVRLSGAAVLLPIAGMASPLNAQSVPPEAAEPASDTSTEEIVVTANKREERLNDVGLTITAISGDALADRNITTLAAISAAVPGLAFSQSSSNTPILTLRGVGFNSAALGAYPAVSVYVDQAPLPFPVLASHAAYDLERVEVLKGPQGTLFGQNATGGAINFIAARPTSVFEAGGDITYGRFNEVQGNAYLSGPISSNLRARIAATAVNGDGWQVSNSRPFDRNGAQSYVAARTIIDWEASDNVRFSLNLNGWIDKSEPQAPQFIALNAQSPAFVQPAELAAPFSPERPRAADWSVREFEPRGDRTFYQATLRADVDLSDIVTLTSMTSYIRFEQDQTQDFDGLPLNITDFQESGTIRSFNQEVRLASTPRSRFRWIIGANYERSNTFNYQFEDFSDNSTAANPFAGFIDTSFQYVRQRIRNYAAFGNVEFDLTPQLRMRAGVRYTRSRNRSDLCVGDGGTGRIVFLFNLLGTFSGQPFTPVTIAPPNNCASLNAQLVPNGGPTSLLLDEDNLSWRVGLDYRLSEDALLYANVSRGYKSGSFPLIPASQTEQFRPVSQESVTSYEAGVKIDLLDRRVHLNAAGFYYAYRDKQVLGRTVVPIFGPSNALVNVPRSRIIGFEADLTARPVEGLTLTGSMTYLTSRIRRYEGYDALGVFGDLSGNRLPFAPKFSYSLDAEYRHRLANRGGPFAGVTITGRSRQDTTVGGGNLVIPTTPSSRVLPGLANPFTTNGYSTVDVRLGYEAPNQAWRVMLFGKNIFNEYYWNNVIDQAETAQRYAGMPRTYGITFGFQIR